MRAVEHNWTFGDPETLMYVAAVFIGVPLTMWELWHLGKTSTVAGLGMLWVLTVAMLMIDFFRGFISRGSLAFFFAWVAVCLGAGIYNYVV